MGCGTSKSDKQRATDEAVNRVDQTMSAGADGGGATETPASFGGMTLGGDGSSGAADTARTSGVMEAGGHGTLGVGTSVTSIAQELEDEKAHEAEKELAEERQAKKQESQKLAETIPPPSTIEPEAVAGGASATEARREGVPVTPPESSLSQHLPDHPASPALSSPRSPKAAMDGEEFAKVNPDGLYLVFDPVNQGTFFARYSKEYLPNALAYARPSMFINIAAFKYKQPISLMTKVQMGKKSYFEGWMAWLKEARQIDGEVVLLPELETREQQDPTKFPPMKMVTLSGAKLDLVAKGLKTRPIRMKFIDVVACVPESYTGFDAGSSKLQLSMERNEFLTRAKTPQDHAYMEF